MTKRKPEHALRKRIARARMRAHLAELCTLDITRTHAAMLLGIHPSYVSVLSNEAGLSWQTGRGTKLARLRRLLAEGIRDQEELAKRLGSTLASVYQMAWREGLASQLILRRRSRTSKSVPAPVRYRLFSVPAARLDEYKELRKLGLTMEEAGWCMGLLARPEVGAALRPVKPS